MAAKNTLIELSYGDVSSSIYLEEEAIIYRPSECIHSIMDEAKKLADGPVQVFTTGEDSRFLSSTNLQQFYQVARENGSDHILVMSLEVQPVDVIDLTIEDETKEEFKSVEDHDIFADASGSPTTPHDIDLMWPASDGKSETIESDSKSGVSDCQSNVIVSECASEGSWECVDESDIPKSRESVEQERSAQAEVEDDRSGEEGDVSGTREVECVERVEGEPEINDESAQETTEAAVLDEPAPQVPDPMGNIVDHIMAVITAQLFGMDIRVVLPILAQKMLDFLADHGIDQAPDSLLKIRDGDVSDIKKCAFECVVFSSSLTHTVRNELITTLQMAAVQLAHQPPPSVVEVHPNIICDGCEMDPIVGKRFKSLRMDNYDLCEKCIVGRNPTYYQQLPGQQADVVSFSHSNASQGGNIHVPVSVMQTVNHPASSQTVTHTDSGQTVTHTDSGQTVTRTHHSQTVTHTHNGRTQTHSQTTDQTHTPVKNDILTELANINGVQAEFVVPILADEIIKLSELFGVTHVVPESLLQVTRGAFDQIQQATRDTIHAINALDEVTRELFVANLQAVLEESIAQEMASMNSLQEKSEMFPSPVVLTCDCINSSMDPGDLDGDLVSFAKDEFKLSGAFFVGQFNTPSIANVTFMNPSGESIENAALRLCYGDGMGFGGMDFGTIAPHEVFEVVMDFSFRPDEPKGLSCWAFTTGDIPIGSLIVADTI